MNNYIDWLKGQGAEYPKLKVRRTDERSTVCLAAKDIYKDEQVLFIPADLILGPGDTSDVPATRWLLWNPKVVDALQSSEHASAALCYLHEKNNAKWKYKRYFDSLPQDNTNHVALWEPATHDVLKASWLYQHIEKLRKAIEMDYELLQKEIPADSRGEYTL